MTGQGIPILTAAALLTLGCGCTAFRANTLPLQETQWTASQIPGTTLSLPPGKQASLEINRERQISGSAGGNYFFGGCQIKGDTLVFHPIGTTRKIVPCKEFERHFLAALKQCRKYRISGNELALLDEKDRVLLRLEGKRKPQL